MRTAIYVRVSTEEQAQEGYSISAQKKRLQAYCDSQAWEVVGFYVDEGISAKNMDRPELQRMNEHIKNGLIDCVLVFRLDRLTRSVLDLYKLLALFDKYDCKFKSATEVYDTTTAMGRLFITIVAALAQWERENTGERVRIGLEEKVRQGKYAAHVKPFGYSLDNATSELTIIPEEARIIKSIYSSYLEGNSTNKIANDLIGTPGAKWSHMQIYKILKNPLYKGTLRWGDKSNNYFEVANAVPPIISSELFDQVQLHLKQRGMKHPRSATSNYIFSGKVRCGLCGNLIVGNKIKGKDREYYNYRCTGRKLKVCNLNISSDDLENLFLNYISTLKYEDEVKEFDLKIEAPVDNREELEQELNTIAKRRKKWQYAWANDMMNDEEFTQRTKEENEREKKIKEKMDNLSPIKTHTKEDIQAVVLELEKNWLYFSEYEKKTFVGILVESFEVSRSGVRGKYTYTIENIKLK